VLQKSIQLLRAWQFWIFAPTATVAVDAAKATVRNDRMMISGVAVFLSAVAVSAAQASVVVYDDMADWSNAVGNHTTIDFVGGELGTPVLDDYAHLGVTFSENTTYAQLSAFTDLAGMRAPGGSTASFDSPQQWIGLDHVGHLLVDFYSGGELIWSSGVMVPPSGENLAFAGFILSESFDSVYLYRLGVDFVAVIDNIYFAVPAPGAFGLLLLAGIARTRRRRV
jgi:MYXO-CTERM domain-containing protein